MKDIRMIARPMVYKREEYSGHQWRLLNCKIDTYAGDEDFHAGPECERCGFSFCTACEPDGFEKYRDDLCVVEGYYCPNCGRELNVKDKFCRHCGQKILRDKEKYAGGKGEFFKEASLFDTTQEIKIQLTRFDMLVVLDAIADVIIDLSVNHTREDREIIEGSVEIWKNLEQKINLQLEEQDNN